MTRGHVILCMLYIKMHRMSRNILEPKRDPFRVCERTRTQGVPPHFLALGGRRSAIFFAAGENQPVCFFRHIRVVFPAHFAPAFPHTRGQAGSPEGRNRRESAGNDHVSYCLSTLIIEYPPALRRMSANRPQIVLMLVWLLQECAHIFSRRVHSASQPGKEKIGA
jgi:hypothetical protein